MKQKENLTKIIVPVLSILVAFIIGGIIILCLGKNPLKAYGFLFSGAFGSSRKIAQTLVIACPLIFTGLTASFSYKCGVFNLGGEGQFVMGAVASIFFVTKSGVEGLPGILISLLIGAACGALWGAIPGILKITRGLNEMIVSIMLNYVATLFMGYVYTTLLRDGKRSSDLCHPRQHQTFRHIKKLPRTLGCMDCFVSCFCRILLFYFILPRAFS